ncbi:cytochrome c biogenesis protein CcsA [Archaeoglobus sp.]
MHLTIIPFALATLILSVCTVKKSKVENVGYVLVIVGLLFYVFSFLADDFTLKEVFLHSSKNLPTIFKLSASWSGSGGFIVWWMSAFAGLSLLKRDRSIYHNLTVVALFIVATLNGAFDSIESVQNGLGLNPLLKNVWMLLHPPASFLSYAFGLFVAIDAVLNDVKISKVGFAWITVTLANVLGGVWSYYTLGWGGYWAWDPVETALLLPWLSLTAYLHSKDRSLLYLTGFSVAFAGFVTRGGISPLHGFAINPSGFAIVLVGIPFLILFFKEFRLKLEAKPMTIATNSLVGMYLVCITALIYQLAFKSEVSVDYYNFANLPFLLILLSILPICNSKEYGKYLKALIVVYAISSILTVLTAFKFITWCPYAPLHVNCAVSLILPVALFSVSSIIGLKRFEHRLIHLSISLLIVAVSVSWPYAFYETSDAYKVKVGEEVGNIIKLKIDGVNFSISKSKVVYQSGNKVVEVPEEGREIVYMDLNGREVTAVISVYPARFLNYINCMHICQMTGFCAMCREFYPVLSDPIIVSEGLNNYYIVVDEYTQSCYMPKNCFALAFKSVLPVVNETKFLEFLNVTCKSYTTQLGETEFIVKVKFVPLINLLWLSCATMVIGEIVARWRK